MQIVAAAGAGFLLAVLWFDLMFDVQVRGRPVAVLPENVLASISAYYRRVTTEASPMNRLVPLAMLATVGAIVGEIVRARHTPWLSWGALALLSPVLANTFWRTVPNAVRLGTARDDAERRSSLARAIYRDHAVAFAAMCAVLALQLAAHGIG